MIKSLYINGLYQSMGITENKTFQRNKGVGAFLSLKHSTPPVLSINQLLTLGATHRPD